MFNCYLHWVVLVMQRGNSTAVFLMAQEGVTLGDPQAMVAYVLGFLPLILIHLKREVKNTDIDKGVELWE